MASKGAGQQSGLTARQKAFVREYLLDLNATAAADRAGYKQPNKQGPRMLVNVGISAAIQQALAERGKRTELDADAIVRHWAAIALADPNELIEIRRACCRHCHGPAFQYQRTSGEMARDRAAHDRATQSVPSMFEELGGEGYDERKRPNKECPECFGEGVARPFPKDTRDLSEGARRLYAGVKVTKDGIEIKMHDQAAALLNLAKHLGMFVTKVEHSGKDGGAIPITIVGVEIVDPAETEKTHETAL